MKLYDNNNTVEITMRVWDNQRGEADQDWSLDFFEAGGLEYNEDLDAYRVESVDYCIDQANDWANARGDFNGDEIPEHIERQVFVEVC